MRESSHSAEDVARAVSGPGPFLLVLHEFPDGDSLGSNLAMAGALRKLDRAVWVAGAAPPPSRFDFLPGFDGIIELARLPRALGEFDCLLLIDCSDPRRAGLTPEELGTARLVVNVDHHPSNTFFGDVNYVDSAASAAAEQVRRIIADLGVALDREIALNLYVALSTDTGGFRFDNTTAGTHLLAAELLERGVKPGPVGEIIHDTRTLSSLRLLERMLGTLSFAAGGRIAWVTVTRKMLDECGAADDEVEGLVAYPRMIDFVDLCFLLQEMRDGVTRIALRSKRDLDVGLIAERLGGGGHRKAAGCLVEGGLDVALGRVLEESKKLLAAQGQSRQDGSSQA